MAQGLGENLAINIGVNVTGLPQIQQVQTRMTGLNKTIQRSTSQYSANAVATNKWAKGALQQAGYQVGDFAVQIAGGTNAIQAFGQQGSQLLGIFGPVGAVLGAAVAIASAVGVAFSKMGGEAKEATQDIKSLSAALNDVEAGARLTGSAFDEYLTKHFEAAEIQIKSLIERLEDVRLDALRQSIGQVMDESSSGLEDIKKEFEDISETIGANMKLMGESPGARTAFERALERAREFKEEVGLTTNEFQIFLDNMERVKSAQTFDSLVNEIARMEEHLARSNAGGMSDFRDKLAELLANSGVFDRMAEGVEAVGDAADETKTKVAQLGKTALSAAEAIFQLNQGILPPQAREDLRFIDSAYELSRELNREITNTGEQSGASTRSVASNVSATTKNALGNIERMFDELDAIVENVSKTIEGSLTSGFMSMIDGTKTVKDAFSDMARAIIADLYEVLVVQRLVGSVKEGTGIAGAIGTALGFRASGGQVTGNKPYIVGERGPEMVVPSRNAHVVPNNKMGGGGGPVQVVYQFQGGVTEADLGRALPLLVERTKREVVDAVQRGGSVARVFR